jgi:hypothetical protein|tara:strand:+ start:309 stop:854 length:546 start_codon:yes stop_codon:yes gene_type:complete
LYAWREIHRIRKDQAYISELPVAQLTALTANINRDTKKQTKPFEPKDFCLFFSEQEKDNVFSAEAAAVALALKHEETYPPLLLTVWPQVLASAADGTRTPKQRALRSDDDAVWLLAPTWEGKNCRAGLALIFGHVHGAVRVRDLDKPLLTYDLYIPDRKGFGWIEAGCLLLAADGRSNPQN